MISKSIFRSKCIIFFADSSIAGAWGKSVKSSTELREPLFCCVRRQTGGRLSNCPKWLKLKCVKQLRTLVIHFHLPNLLSPLHTSVTGSLKINGMEILKLVCFLRTQLICTRSTCILLRPWGPPWMGNCARCINVHSWPRKVMRRLFHHRWQKLQALEQTSFRTKSSFRAHMQIINLGMMHSSLNADGLWINLTRPN